MTSLPFDEKRVLSKIAKKAQKGKVPIVKDNGKIKFEKTKGKFVAPPPPPWELPVTTTLPENTVVTGVDILAYMRALPIDFIGYNIRPNRRVYPHFDSVDVSNYIQRPNKIVLGSNARFQTMLSGPIPGIHYTSNGIAGITQAIDSSREEIFIKNGKARVLFTEYDESGNTIIYTTHIEPRKFIEPGCWLPPYKESDVSVPVSSAAIPANSGGRIISPLPVFAVDSIVNDTTVVGVKTGTQANLVSYEHYTGVAKIVTYADVFTLFGDPSANGEIVPPITPAPNVNPVIDFRRIKLADDASTIDNWYNGNTITFVNGGQPGALSNIVSYNGTTRIAEISTPNAYSSTWVGLPPRSNLIYSIGDSRIPFSASGNKQAHFTTNKGFLTGVLHIPDPSTGVKFRVGERIFSITDSPNNDVNDATTYAEYKFVSSGLQISQRQIVTSTNVVVPSPPPPTPPLPPPTPPGPPVPPPPSAPPPTPPEKEQRNDKRDKEPKKKDPVAQSFFVSAAEYPQGMFVPFIDVFFASKGILPVEMQIRPLINGFPSSDIIIPNAVSIVQSEDVKVSAAPNANDPNTYTRFAFPSPVYLAPDTDYAFVVLTNDFDYDLYVSELGEKIIGSDRVVSEQPYLGSLFKSQNATTYTAIQSEDIMFVIHKCNFNSSGSIIFNEKKNFTYTNPYFNKFFSSNVVFDAFEVQSDTVEVPGTKATFSYKSTTNSNLTEDSEYTIFQPETRTLLPVRKIVYGPDIEKRSFSMKVDLQTTSADISPVVYVQRQGISTLTTVINNMGITGYRVNIKDPGANQTTQNTSITFSGKTGSGANATAVIKIEPVKTGKLAGLNFDSFGQDYYDNVTCTVVSSDPNVTVANVSIDSETGKAGGPALARYISKTVTLAPEFAAGDLRVYLTAVKPPEANIQVYYKVRNSYDADPISEKNWVRMEQRIGTFNYSTNLKPIELEFRPSMTSNNIIYSTNTATFDTFSQFKIKIVMASSDTVLTKIPYIYDMRAIALPADSV